jgi:hypothetical protein
LWKDFQSCLSKKKNLTEEIPTPSFFLIPTRAHVLGFY